MPFLFPYTPISINGCGMFKVNIAVPVEFAVNVTPLVAIIILLIVLPEILVLLIVVSVINSPIFIYLY